MADAHPLMLYNTLTRRKEEFVPLDAQNVRMYVCGPTVYDYAHIGNARPVIVFDVLFRLLRQMYGAKHVTYVRNITDVDDKINARAAEEYPRLPLNRAIRRVTRKTELQFQRDIRSLHVLRPSKQPRATEHIEEMKRLIDELVANGHAYVAEGHVLFDVNSMPDYGRLANRSLKAMRAGARVDVAPYKKDPLDFVLWKPSKPGEPSWPSPAGIADPGRPGWHIECSAMAEKHLGQMFDIHGGGIDLVFPHHENEIAQSRCAHDTPVMANFWLHNGFLQVEGEKMSKSLGNFITIHDLLRTDKFGGRCWSGDVLRVAMLQTHYTQPIDWTVRLLEQAESRLQKWIDFAAERTQEVLDQDTFSEFVGCLKDDLNTPEAFGVIDRLCSSEPDIRSRYTVFKLLKLFGIDAKRTPEANALIKVAPAIDHVQRLSVEDWAVLARRAEDDHSHILDVPADLEVVASLLAASELQSRLREIIPSDRAWLVEEDFDQTHAWNFLSSHTNHLRWVPENHQLPLGLTRWEGAEASSQRELQSLQKKLHAAFEGLSQISLHQWKLLGQRVDSRAPNTRARSVELALLWATFVLATMYERLKEAVGREIESPRVTIWAGKILDRVAPRKTEFDRRIDALVERRNSARLRRDYTEADRLRSELQGMGILLKDAKDPHTGEIVTTWELAR